MENENKTDKWKNDVLMLIDYRINKVFCTNNILSFFLFAR